MRAKLQQIKQQLRSRMHHPVAQTGEWLKSVVRGYFNYHAVPGNLDRLGVFRERVTGSGGGLSLVAARTIGSLGPACTFWRSDGFPNRACSILIPRFALPLGIYDKSRMR